MLADSIVQAVQWGINSGRVVRIETETYASTRVLEIEHVGEGLIRFRNALPNDIFVPAARIKQVMVMADDWIDD